MRHEVLRGRAVPVLFPAADADDVPGADGDERSASRLDVADAFGDVQRLADGVVVPGGVGARGEVHGADGEGGALRLGDRVDVDVAGEPLGGSLHRLGLVDALHRGLLRGGVACGWGLTGWAPSTARGGAVRE